MNVSLLREIAAQSSGQVMIKPQGVGETYTSKYNDLKSGNVSMSGTEV